MKAKVYVIVGSHACRTATLMLEYKRIPYRVIELPTGLHPLLVRAAGFPGHATPIRTVGGSTHSQLAMLDRLGTVPAMVLDGERVQSNREIARQLERVCPDPPLSPRTRLVGRGSKRRSDGATMSCRWRPDACSWQRPPRTCVSGAREAASARC